MGMNPGLILLLFIPLSEAICPTTLPTDGAFTSPNQYHSGSVGEVPSTHLLSYSNPSPSVYSLAYPIVSGSFLKAPTTQCPQSCMYRLRAMGKPNEDSINSIVMVADSGENPPATNILYRDYTTTVVPGEYLYCSTLVETCGAAIPLYLYYNSKTDDYQVRGANDTNDDEGAQLANQGLPICYLFPHVATTTSSSTTYTSTSTTTVTTSTTEEGSSSSTSSSSSTTTTTQYTGSSTTANPSVSTTTAPINIVYTGPSTTADPLKTTTSEHSTTTYTGPSTTTSGTSTTAYTGPSTTADPSVSSTSTSNSDGGSITTTQKPMTTTSPYAYSATTDASGTFGPGDQKLENGTIVRTNGDMIYPNGTVKNADGSVIENGKKIDPDGTVHNPDGSTAYANGTVVYPPSSNNSTTSDSIFGGDTPGWVIPVIIGGILLLGICATLMILFGVTSMMKAGRETTTVNPYDRQNEEQWPNQRQPSPSTDLPPPVAEPVTTAQPQSFGATQSFSAPNPLYFG